MRGAIVISSRHTAGCVPCSCSMFVPLVVTCACLVDGDSARPGSMAVWCALRGGGVGVGPSIRACYPLPRRNRSTCSFGGKEGKEIPCGVAD